MNSLFALTVAVAVGLAGVAVPATAQEATVTLTVSVVTPSGDPVPGAELDATWDGGSRRVTTAGNGEAFVDVPEGATVSFEATHPDYLHNEPLEGTDAGADEVPIKAFPKGRLAVDVEDANGPLSDAQVIVRKRGALVDSGDTGTSGRYRSGDVEQGTHTVTVRKPGYFRNVSTVDVDGRITHDVAVERGSVTLHFNVSDSHFSPPEPIGGVSLSLESIGEFNTLESGEQDVRVPVDTELSLTATEDGYEPNETAVVIEESALESPSLCRAPPPSTSPRSTSGWSSANVWS